VPFCGDDKSHSSSSKCFTSFNHARKSAAGFSAGSRLSFVGRDEAQDNTKDISLNHDIGQRYSIRKMIPGIYKSRKPPEIHTDIDVLSSKFNGEQMVDFIDNQRNCSFNSLQQSHTFSLPNDSLQPNILTPPEIRNSHHGFDEDLIDFNEHCKTISNRAMTAAEQQNDQTSNSPGCNKSPAFTYPDNNTPLFPRMHVTKEFRPIFPNNNSRGMLIGHPVVGAASSSELVIPPTRVQVNPFHPCNAPQFHPTTQGYLSYPCTQRGGDKIHFYSWLLSRHGAYFNQRLPGIYPMNRYQIRSNRNSPNLCSFEYSSVL